ncbi:RNA polymerase sigma factor [Riemerella columbina]|uniref:RNA polymerase sigma factor n=1 Tax=Riemerella columbina TaxID=103810 RepID=UPI0003A1B423|nr:sigma-70 family RNA polymerase sigma factor [Riemerella columbina]
MVDEFQNVFKRAQQQDRTAQKQLFQQFSGKMLMIVQSYVSQSADAEDVLMEAFYKAFTKINQCQCAEAFSSWLRRIVINEAISFIRKHQPVLYIDHEIPDEVEVESLPPELPMDLQTILEAMPIGYRMVFNLYVFEDKKHAEIADILNIKEGTSKSQYNKAKKWLKAYLIKEKYHEK